MTHDEMIAVIQAHKEGKTIQYLHLGDEWEDLKNPSFNFDWIEYRVKPEPREFWIAVCEESGNILDGSSVKKHVGVYGELIKVREVIEEEK